MLDEPAEDPMIKLRLTSDNKSQLDQDLQGLHMLSYMGGMVSMTAAMFIVFSSLSRGAGRSLGRSSRAWL